MGSSYAPAARLSAYLWSPEWHSSLGPGRRIGTDHTGRSRGPYVRSSRDGHPGNPSAHTATPEIVK